MWKEQLWRRSFGGGCGASACRQGVPDAGQQVEADEREWRQEHRPEPPIAHGNVAERERLHASAKVDEAVNDTDGSAGPLASAEVHGGCA